MFVPQTQHVNIRIVRLPPRALSAAKVDEFVPQNKLIHLRIVGQDEDSDSERVVQLEHAPHRARHRVPCSQVDTFVPQIHIYTAKFDIFVPQTHHVNIGIVRQPHRPRHRVPCQQPKLTDLYGKTSFSN